MLRASKPPPPKFYPPLFRCIPPPQYKLLKLSVLRDYHYLQNTVPAPRFISVKPNTLSKELIRARLSPTEDQMFDIHLLLANQVISTHTTAGHLPTLRIQPVRTQKCKHPRCVMCTHLFSQVYKNRNHLHPPAQFCLYFKKCNLCHNMYKMPETVCWLTTTCQDQSPSIYLARHFNLPDHTVKNLSVQAIDQVPDSHENLLQELSKLEKYWISTLRTLQPLGLNVSPGSCT